MKKVTLLLLSLFVCTLSYSQTKATTEDGRKIIVLENGTWIVDTTQNTKPTITLPNTESKSFNWKDGYDNIVSVKFIYMIKSKFDKEVLDKIVMSVMTKSKYKLKNKLSFVPKELTLMEMKDGTYSAISKFYGKNSYGAEGKETAYFKFDKDGNVTGL